ncbi:MAG: NAD(P)-dependent oxidoreductase [Planctomycetes bacterium]|nr:NAD(P)-dependent oxidoreductase [Planctomycetota bacterium]
MITTAMSKRLLLITGSEGRIGSVIGPRLARRYAVRSADVKKSTWNAEHIRASLARLAPARRACRGVDTVIHLAHAPMEPDDAYMTPKDPNLPMLLALLKAARLEGCRRIICASSVHAISGYPEDVRVTEDMRPRPDCRYGVFKALVEAACAQEADRGGPSAFAVRIGSCHGPKQERVDHPLTYSAYVHWRDLLQLMRLMIEAADELRHGVFHGVSRVRKPRMSFAMTKRMLAYEPKMAIPGA